jgi:Fanconi anemia group M protein
MEARDYQHNAAESILAHGNSLLVMPTALGKTFVAAIIMRKLGGKQLFLVPTKPLAVQQAKRFEELLGEAVLLVTGELSPEKRKQAYAGARIIVATPQCIQNDVLSRKLRLQDFKLVVFDEAHRTVGDYAYSFIASQAREHCFVLGLTASPSSNKEKIHEVCNNLGVKHIEVKGHEDEDVQKYANEVDFKWEFVDLPGEYYCLRERLLNLLKEALAELKDYGFVDSASPSRINKSKLLALRKPIMARMPNSTSYKALSSQARALNLLHAIDLLESQGANALCDFFDGLRARDKKSKAVRRLLADPLYNAASAEASELVKQGSQHPKMPRLAEIVLDSAKRGQSMMVFAHYRSSVNEINRVLNALPGVDARPLVGRSKDGMTQKQQAAVLDSFRAREFNALVSTSVGEEGLDIPAVDLVIFYESVPSEIRLIQRRGRAGRVKAGRVILLVTRDTKDEGFLWISRSREKRMRSALKEASDELENPGKQLTFGDL